MQVGLSDLKMLTGHQGRNKPSLTDVAYIHTLGREYLSAYSNQIRTTLQITNEYRITMSQYLQYNKFI